MRARSPRDGLRVLVLDARYAANAATAAGMGHLVVMDDSPAQLALTTLSLALWRELAPTLPLAVEYDACGTIWVAADERELDAVHEKQRLYTSAGIASEVLGPRDLATLEPNLRPGLAGGLLVPGDGVVYQPRATSWLLDQARARGATVREHCAVDRIGDHAVHCGDEVLHAEVIVNAAGAEAPRLTPALPIVPRKGHLAITDRHPGLRASSARGARLSRERAHDDRRVRRLQRAAARDAAGAGRLVARAGGMGRVARIASVLARMLARAIEYMPALATLSAIRAWTGMRPATPDKLPLIGAWEPTPGLWIAAGHEGLGITTSLGDGAPPGGSRRRPHAADRCGAVLADAGARVGDGARST